MPYDPYPFKINILLALINSKSNEILYAVCYVIRKLLIIDEMKVFC